MITRVKIFILISLNLEIYMLRSSSRSSKISATFFLFIIEFVLVKFECLEVSGLEQNIKV